MTGRFLHLTTTALILLLSSQGRALVAQPIPATDEVADFVRARQVFNHGDTSPALWWHETALPEGIPGRLWASVYSPPPTDATRLGFRLISPTVTAFTNSARPAGMNDGAVWQGRGLTTRLTGGAHLAWGRLEVSARPTFFVAENQSFGMSRFVTESDRSRYGAPHRTDVDVPQRFGLNPYSLLTAGESRVRYAGNRFSFGWTSGSARIGAARWNPLILSTNAGGVSRLYVQSESPLGTPLGAVQALWFVGQLSGSGYFDVGSAVTSPDDDRRSLSVMAVSIEPRGVPGLHVGLTSARVARTSGRLPAFSDWVSPASRPFVGTAEEDPSFGLVAISVRWLLPGDGAEIYGEWGRRTGAGPLRQLLFEPDRHGAYVLGVRTSVFRRRTRWLVLSAEYADLERARTWTSAVNEARHGDPSFYTHAGVPEGYTHRGQFLGAAIGPGSTMAVVAGDWYAPWGRAGIELHRTALDADAHLVFLDGRSNFSLFEVELGMSASAFIILGPVELGLRAGYARLLNKDYVLEQDETNYSGMVSLRFRLGDAR